MNSQKKRPQIYWSQNESEINIKVDLLLDDMKPDIKIDEKFLSLDAYGFGSKDEGPQKYYFGLHLFESINVEASMENVSISNSQLKFVMKKQNPRIWWSRLTAQPQKQNWIHIDEETWISRNPGNSSSDDTKEFRDIRTDYPGVDDFVHQEELGYRKVDRRTVYLILYNLYQFVAYFYIFLVLAIELKRDGLVDASKQTYKTVGAVMKGSQILQYLECLHALVGYTRGSALSVWVILYPLGFMCEGLVLLISLGFFEETKRYTITMPNKWNFTFNMVIFLRIYMTFVLLPGLYIVMKHMQALRVKKLKKPTIRYVATNADSLKRKTI